MNKKLNDATKHIKMQGQSLDFGGRAIINAKLINCEGAGGGGSDPNAVKYTKQNLTDLQKAQARTNIGAGSAADVSANAAAIAAETSRAVAAEGTLQSLISGVNRGEMIVAWDGSSAPVAADIPAGVSVTYDGSTVTGTLAASSTTAGKIYLVSDGNDEYDRYIATPSGSSYAWSPLGSTTIDLSDYATEAELSALDQEVTVSDTMSVTPTILAGYRVDGTQLKIIAVSDESTYYIPVANGKAYTIAYALTSGPARSGFFTTQPASGVAVTSNYLKFEDALARINFVAPSDGYFAISFVTASITSVSFVVEKDGIGTDVFLLNEKTKVIDQILKKKSVPAEEVITGGLIRFSNGTLVAAEGFNVAVFRISEGLTYFASGVVPTDVTRTGIAMYDASMQYVAFDAQGDSVGRAYSDKRLVIPSGVAYLRIVGTSDNPAALVSQFNAPDILSTQNLFVTTDYSGFINAQGAHSNNANLDSCLLQLIPGKTYRFVQQVISTTGNYVRIFKFVAGTLTQVTYYQGKVPVVYTCPSDGYVYYAQVIDDTRVIDSEPAIFIASAGIDEMVADLAATRQSLKVLFVGNSHSRDAFAYLPMLLENEVPGISLHLGILYQAACTLAQHYQNIANGTDYPEFDEYKSETGAWVTDNTGKTFDEAAAMDNWDVIVLQQRSHIAGNYSVYEPYLSNIVELFGQKVSYPVKLGWFMVFALADDYTDQPEESSDAQYATIAEATQEMMEHSPFEFVIPVATAIQNARQIPALKALGTGGDMTYEGLHLQEGLPCLCAAYCAALKFMDIMGLGKVGIYGNTIRPDAAWLTSKNIPQQHGTVVGVTKDNCLAAQRCAMFSVRRPYELSPATP